MSRLATRGLELRTRTLGGTDFALRAQPDAEISAGAVPVFAGHAAVFNSRTAIGNPLTWGFFEQVDPGAFTKTLQEGDARFLVDHDTALLVARVSAGDLRLSTDSVGLAVDADLDPEDRDYVQALIANLRGKRITGMSFGFRTIRDSWDTETVEAQDASGNPLTVEVDVRTLLEVQLFEVSAVTFPAYEDTDADLMSAAVAIHRSTDSGLLARRTHPDFLAAYREVAAPEHRRQPAETTGEPSEPDGRTTPTAGPGAGTTPGSLDLLRVRHQHYRAAMQLGKR